MFSTINNSPDNLCIFHFVNSRGSKVLFYKH